MTPHRITAREAVEFFRHPSQQVGFKAEDVARLEGEPVEFWACGPICGLFVYGLWPGVWNVHYGVKPEGWGRLVEPVRLGLEAFWDAHDAVRITGWTEASNRPAVALARRAGFVEDGRLPLPSGEVIMQGWVKCQQQQS